MSSAASRHEYQQRMHRVLEHIDRHLDQPLNLAALAEVAHFSPFHFHRLFAALTRETLGDYLRRRRVEVAAMRLVAQPRLTVLQAALAVGFGSGEAFARAFKQRLGASPSAWRAQHRKGGQAHSKIGQADFAPALDDGGLFPPLVEVPMTVTLIDRPPTHVAYLRHTGPYGEPVARFWQERVYPWMVTNGLLAQPRYGISHDDPSITDPALCRYDACVEVAAGTVLSGGAMTTTLPGGRYAVQRFEGTVDEIGAAWSSLLRNWLASSGLQLDARPCLEHYPQGSAFDPQTGVFDCEICIPVAPL